MGVVFTVARFSFDFSVGPVNYMRVRPVRLLVTLYAELRAKSCGDCLARLQRRNGIPVPNGPGLGLDLKSAGAIAAY